MLIAVDGPAGSGKGTIARRLARHLDLPYLDTGLLYRGVAHAVLQKGQEPSGSFIPSRHPQFLAIPMPC